MGWGLSLQYFIVSDIEYWVLGRSRRLERSRISWGVSLQYSPAPVCSCCEPKACCSKIPFRNKMQMDNIALKTNQMKRKCSDWFSPLTHLLHISQKFYKIFYSLNICTEEWTISVQQTLSESFDKIFLNISNGRYNFVQKADRQLQSYCHKVFHNFSPQTGFNQTRDC